MQVVFTIALLASILRQGDADVTCKLPAPVEKFAASYYTALIVSNDPGIVDTLTVTGDVAAMLVYRVAKKSLDAFPYRKCNGEELAFITSHAVSNIANLTLPIYWDLEAKTVGKVLYQFGVLDCDNAVPLSLEYLTYNREDAEAYKLDPHKFDTYIHEIIFGGFRLYLAHGLSLETVLEPTVDAFHQLITAEKKANQNCVG